MGLNNNNQPFHLYPLEFFQLMSVFVYYNLNCQSCHICYDLLKNPSDLDVETVCLKMGGKSTVVGSAKNNPSLNMASIQTAKHELIEGERKGGR